MAHIENLFESWTLKGADHVVLAWDCHRDLAPSTRAQRWMSL